MARHPLDHLAEPPQVMDLTARRDTAEPAAEPAGPPGERPDLSRSV